MKLRQDLLPTCLAVVETRGIHKYKNRPQASAKGSEKLKNKCITQVGGLCGQCQDETGRRANKPQTPGHWPT